MEEKSVVWQRLRLFGGYIEMTGSDLYRFHLRIGPLALYLESKSLYTVTQEMRSRERAKQ